MNRKRFTRRASAAALLLVGVLGAGVAVAAWTQTGTGSGSAKALTAVSSTIVATSPAASLYPGKTGAALTFTVDNPNPYPVTFTSLAAGTITSSDPTNCPVNASNVTVTTPITVSIVLPASAAATAQSVSGVVNMPNTAANGCQGVTFTVAATLTGTSS